MWHQYVQNAVLNYHTTYHETKGCELYKRFDGRIPHDVLDLKLGDKVQWKTTTNLGLAEQLQNQTKDFVIKVLSKKTTQSGKLGRNTHKRYKEYEFAPTCQSNVYLTSQKSQTNIYQIRTSRKRSTNGMLHHG